MTIRIAIPITVTVPNTIAITTEISVTITNKIAMAKTKNYGDIHNNYSINYNTNGSFQCCFKRQETQSNGSCFTVKNYKRGNHKTIAFPDPIFRRANTGSGQPPKPSKRSTLRMKRSTDQT